MTAFSVDGSGRLSDRRVFAQLPDGHAPDGMCLDGQGAVWVAAVTRDVFLRVAEGGEVLDRVPVPGGRHAIACVLGGPDRRSLMMLTAETYGEADRSRALRSARVEQVRVEVAGAGLP